jgi:hypothetical protein
LVGQLRKARGENDLIAQRLSAFVDQRTWLVHKLRRDNYLTLRDDAGFREVTLRVETITLEAERLIELFDNLLVEHFLSLGISKEHIDQEQRKAEKDVYRE